MMPLLKEDVRTDRTANISEYPPLHVRVGGYSRWFLARRAEQFRASLVSAFCNRHKPGQ
jgi:hypothetical protein